MRNAKRIGWGALLPAYLVVVMAAVGVATAKAADACDGTWSDAGGIYYLGVSEADACAAETNRVQNAGYTMLSCHVAGGVLTDNLTSPGSGQFTHTLQQLPAGCATGATTAPVPTAPASGTVLTLDPGTFEAPACAAMFAFGWGAVVTSYLLAWGVGTVLSMVDTRER